MQRMLHFIECGMFEKNELNICSVIAHQELSIEYDDNERANILYKEFKKRLINFEKQIKDCVIEERNNRNMFKYTNNMQFY